jgi:hypothetical protein
MKYDGISKKQNKNKTTPPLNSNITNKFSKVEYTRFKCKSQLYFYILTIKELEIQMKNAIKRASKNLKRNKC